MLSGDGRVSAKNIITLSFMNSHSSVDANLYSGVNLQNLSPISKKYLKFTVRELNESEIDSKSITPNCKWF